MLYKPFAALTAPIFLVWATTASAETLEASCVGLLITGHSEVEAKDCGAVLSKVIDNIENESVKFALITNAEMIGVKLSFTQPSSSPKLGSKAGFCRVSNGDFTTIYDDEPCTKTLRTCDEKGACIIDFTWPSGSKTVVESNYNDVNSAYRINGQQAGLTNRMGEGSSPDLDCVANFGSQKMFCFSETGFLPPPKPKNNGGLVFSTQEYRPHQVELTHKDENGNIVKVDEVSD